MGKSGPALRQAVLSESESMQYAVLGKLLSKADSVAAAASSAEAAARENAQRVTLILVALSVFVAIALGLWLYRGIVRPLGIARDYADRVAAGEYSASLGRHTNDEIGALTHAIENMKDNLVHEMEVMREMSGVIMITTEGIRASVSEIERVSREGSASQSEIDDGLIEVGQQSDLLLELATQMLGV
jgi:methyl-accepting chemotaxis protein